MEILVVEDCQDTYQLIKQSLNPYQVHHAPSLSDARDHLKDLTPTIVILDVELPDGDGVRFCNELSNDPVYSDIPCILLTGRSEVNDKVFGLNSGADDYMTKPFSGKELKARCEARTRKRKRSLEIEQGPFRVNLEFQTVLMKMDNQTEVDIKLTPTEFKIFHCLLVNSGSAFSRRELVRKIWKQNGTSIEARGLDTHMSHLRKKLGRNSSCIVSIYGRGYSFDESRLPALAA